MSGVVWTAEMIECLKALVVDKELSYKNIASMLSKQFGVTVTKNACIGKGRRLGLDPRLTGYQRQPVVAKAGKVKRKYVKTVKTVRVDAPIAPAIADRKAGEGVTIYQLREGDCKWPLCEMTDYPPFMYCGEPAILGKPWCLTHQKLAHSEWAPRLRAKVA